MPFAPAFDQRPLRVKWGSSQHPAAFVTFYYDASAASPALVLSITGVGSFNVNDSLKKFQFGVTHVDITTGAVTPEMWNNLYAWSYTTLTNTTNDGNFDIEHRKNTVVINWNLIKKNLGLSAINFTISASAAPSEHSFPGVDYRTYDIWQLGDIIENPGGPLVAMYRVDTGVTTIEAARSASPPLGTFSTFDAALAYANGLLGGGTYPVIAYDPDEPPPVLVWDKFSFGVEVVTYAKTRNAFVVVDGFSYSITIDAPDSSGWFNATGSDNLSSGHGESFADWTVTGHINSDLLDGTLVLDPEDDIVIG
jgi:hypothetical protein